MAAMSWNDWLGHRKRRPRSRVIADMSVNFLERQVLRRGHRLIRIPEESDDGTDAIMRTHHPETTEVETGQVDFQLKAKDNLRVVDDGRSISCAVETAHLHFWYHQLFHPFILVLYDAQKHRAFWLDVQHYLDAHMDELGQAVENEAATVTVRIPVKNKLNVLAIDRFRRLVLDRPKRLKSED
jgi:hypothetical protein